MPSQFFLWAILRPGFLILALAALPQPCARAADAPGLVGTWHPVGRNGAATLEFKADGVVMLRAGGKETRGAYQTNGSQSPMQVSLDLSPGGPQRWAVEFTGPNEFRQERVAPSARPPAHLGKGAMTFVRAGYEFADTAIPMPTDGTTGQFADQPQGWRNRDADHR